MRREIRLLLVGSLVFLYEFRKAEECWTAASSEGRYLVVGKLSPAP